MKEIKTGSKAHILQLISQSETALSHHDLQQIIGDAKNRVTIYRILDKLVEEGAVHKVIDTDGISKFAACHQCSHTHHVHNHVHFSCTQCHEVTCLKDLIPSFEIPENYTVLESNFVLSGICPVCNGV